MASTFFGLTISYTGLQAANTSINVTAHNISNINTDGYTKEAAETQASKALRSYTTYGTLGSGVTVTEISQIRDTYYDEKYRNNQSYLGEYETKDSYMNQIENYLNEFTLEGFTSSYEDFYAALKQAQITPSEESTLNEVVNKAASMTDYFNVLATNLRNVQVDANNEVRDAVEQINSLAQNIASLNKQINQVEACAGNANDLRDQRNALIDDLAEYVNISTMETDLGNGLTDFAVYIDGQPLISGYDYFTLETVAREDPRNASDADGLYDIKWSTGNTFNIYSDSLGGQLKALIDIRDGCNGETEVLATDEDGNYLTDSDGNYYMTMQESPEKDTSFKGIPYYQSQLNQFISTFTSAVNDILKSGYSSDGEHAGISLFVTQNNTTSMTATNVTVNEELINDSSLFATKSSVAQGEANADIINKLLDLESSKIFDGGTGGFFLESIVSDMSIDASKATSFHTNYENLQTTIQNQRLSIMGVDTDEEAMDLVKFQQAYNLNSKMMSVMNELYDRLINETGV